jgi:hypothetical protein
MGSTARDAHADIDLNLGDLDDGEPSAAAFGQEDIIGLGMGLDPALERDLFHDDLRAASGVGKKKGKRGRKVCIS